MIIGHKKWAEAITQRPLHLCPRTFVNVHNKLIFKCHYLLHLLPVIGRHPQVSDKEIIFENKTHVAHSGSAA